MINDIQVQRNPIAKEREKAMRICAPCGKILPMWEQKGGDVTIAATEHTGCKSEYRDSKLCIQSNSITEFISGTCC